MAFTTVTALGLRVSDRAKAVASARRWTATEDACLCELYDAGQSRVAIGAALGRSADAVDARRRFLAHPRRTPLPRPWTGPEDAFLRAASRARVPISEICRRLDRSGAAIRKRREELSLTHPRGRRFTSGEQNKLRLAVLNGRSIAEVAAEMGRSEDAVRLYARERGILTVARRRRWSVEEDARLREGYNSGFAAERIRTELLPKRSAGAIVARARLLGLATFARRWTDDEERQLAALVAAQFPLDAVARSLVRSQESILCRCRRLRLPTPAPNPIKARRVRWTPREDDRLRCARYDTLGLARLLGRSEQTVRRRRNELGLSRAPRSAHHLLPANGDLTPGQRRQIMRELPLTARHALAAAARIEVPLAELQAVARRHNHTTTTSMSAESG